MLYQAGKVSDLQIKQYKEEAEDLDRKDWYYAYQMDINEEEKERGKTVETGMAPFETEHKRFTLIDCPGHKNYIQNMLMGAAQADVAGLIISARKGEFEAGFLKEG